MSIALVMLSSHLILWLLLLLLLSSIFPSIRDFSDEFTSDDPNTGASASASVLSTSIQGWFPLRMTGLVPLMFKGLSEVFSSITVQRHKFLGILPSLWSSSHNRTRPLGRPWPWLYIWTFVSSNISAFSTLSRFIIAFLPTKKQLSSDFMAAVTICSDFRSQEEEICHYFHLFPFYLTWSNGARCHDLSFFKPEFKLALSLSSFTLCKRLFSSSVLSAIRVVSSVYLSLLMFPPFYLDSSL